MKKDKKKIGLPELGVVGSINFITIRTSLFEAILVEQAFISNVKDEEHI